MQPFFVASLGSWPEGVAGRHARSAEVGHTYRTWKVDRSLQILRLDEATFLAMPRSRRAALVRSQVECGRGAVPAVRRWSALLDPAPLRAQADGHRFVWWPSVVAGDLQAILSRVVLGSPDGTAADGLPSRHDDVRPSTWDACAAALPGARSIAGSFPASSGPNCFGSVMAAAGVDGAGDELVVEAPFLAWLGTACRPGGGSDDVAGTVLLWRDGAGVPVHAAVTIGDGWALEKASSEWWTPVAVRRARDVIRASRLPGQRLERHRIVTTPIMR